MTKNKTQKPINLEFLKGKKEAIETSYQDKTLKEIPLIILIEYINTRKEIEKYDSKN